MRPQKQKYRHRPAEGTIGDCHRTAIACVLDLARDEVPHFAEEHFQDAVKFHAAFDRWLEDRGHTQVTLAWSGSLELQAILDGVGCLNPDLHWLLGGKSRTGVSHTVVCRGNRIAWDPSLDDAGIIGPCQEEGESDAFWYATFIGSSKCKGTALAITVTGEAVA